VKLINACLLQNAPMYDSNMVLLHCGNVKNYFNMSITLWGVRQHRYSIYHWF